MNEAAFYFIVLCLAIFSVLSVTVQDVFHSAVWLALTLLSVAFVFFFLDAEFLGVVQILVYVGGIMTLFIFAIKLTAKIGDPTIKQHNAQLWPGFFIAAALFLIFLQAILRSPWAHTASGEAGTDLPTIGKMLLTTYALPFEFISLLLLAALVGALVIGKVRK